MATKGKYDIMTRDPISPWVNLKDETDVTKKSISSLRKKVSIQLMAELTPFFLIKDEMLFFTH